MVVNTTSMGTLGACVALAVLVTVTAVWKCRPSSRSQLGYAVGGAGGLALGIILGICVTYGLAALLFSQGYTFGPNEEDAVDAALLGAVCVQGVLILAFGAVGVGAGIVIVDWMRKPSPNRSPQRS